MRKPTQILRATLTQELDYVLGPETDAPAGAVRKVRLLTQGELTFFALDHDPALIGVNRNYKVPEIPPNAVIPFVMGADQFLIGCSDDGVAYCTLVVEYL